MKSARHIEDTAGAPGQGATIVNAGQFPVKPASVVAEVLARLLSGERLRGLDAVNAASTTRLAAAIHYLSDAYGWAITREDRAAGCRDGRVAWVKVYRLTPATIEAAMQSGAAAWCAVVRAARAELRSRAADAQREAQRANAAAHAARCRRAATAAAQGDLFQGGEL